MRVKFNQGNFKGRGLSVLSIKATTVSMKILVSLLDFCQVMVAFFTVAVVNNIALGRWKNINFIFLGDHNFIMKS